MAKSPKTTAKAAGDDTISAPAIDPADNVFNGADPALFDHDHDGHPGGSLPMSEREPTPPDTPIGSQDPLPIRELPTVGRIVHFYENSAQEKPLAAIVTEVDPEFGIKLTVFRPLLTHPISSFIPYVDDLVADGPAWKWPMQTLSVLGLPLANVGSLSDKFPGATGDTVFGERKR